MHFARVALRFGLIRILAWYWGKPAPRRVKNLAPVAMALTLNSACGVYGAPQNAFWSGAFIRTPGVCSLGEGYGNTGSEYIQSVFMHVSGYQQIRALGRYAKGRRERGRATRQDTVMYVVTVQTALVKGAFVPPL